MNSAAETAVTLATAAITILWSVRSFFFADSRQGLRDESPFRMVSIVAPSAYFLLLVFSGWNKEAVLRLDLVGMLVLDVISLLALLLSFLFQAMRGSGKKTAVALFGTYHFLAVVIVAGVFVVKNNAVWLIAVSSLFHRADEIHVFSFAWVGLDTSLQEQDLTAFLNRILIAVFSYVPIALLRFFTDIRRRKRLEREIKQLKRRVTILETSTNRSEI